VGKKRVRKASSGVSAPLPLWENRQKRRPKASLPPLSPWGKTEREKGEKKEGKKVHVSDGAALRNAAIREKRNRRHKPPREGGKGNKGKRRKNKTRRRMK